VKGLLCTFVYVFTIKWEKGRIFFTQAPCIHLWHDKCNCLPEY